MFLGPPPKHFYVYTTTIVRTTGLNLTNIWSRLHIDYQKPEDKPVDVVDIKLGHYATEVGLTSSRASTL